MAEYSPLIRAIHICTGGKHQRISLTLCEDPFRKVVQSLALEGTLVFLYSIMYRSWTKAELVLKLQRSRDWRLYHAR